MQMDAQVNPSSKPITKSTPQSSNLLSRAAYFGQELLSTFGTSIGEIALIPATGGIFKVHITYKPSQTADDTIAEPGIQEVLIWDRKPEGGFPETKILKQRVRNLIEPEKNLGHSDTPSSKAKGKEDDQVAAMKVENQRAPTDAAVTVQNGEKADAAACEDCK